MVSDEQCRAGAWKALRAAHLGIEVTPVDLHERHDASEELGIVLELDYFLRRIHVRRGSTPLRWNPSNDSRKACARRL